MHVHETESTESTETESTETSSETQTFNIVTCNSVIFQYHS